METRAKVSQDYNSASSISGDDRPMFDALNASKAARPMQFEWSICALCVGIGLYFWLPFEPIWEIGFTACLICVAALLILSRYFWGKANFTRSIILAITLVFAGGTRAALHTDQSAAPRLEDYRQSYDVTGWIEAVEKSGKGFRWRLNVDSVSNRYGKLSPQDMPLKLRVKTKPLGFTPGDAITIRALMTGPPGPVIADGYDPAQRAFFERVGGYGFAIGAPQAAEIKTSGLENVKRGLTRFRFSVTSRILERAPANTAGLQAALLTGERAFIPDVQVESLRASGLAHVLAISGLHMGLVAGGAFFVITLLLAAIEPLARNYDVRKPAAAIAMIVATFYLLLSTGTVSIQRAYIMGMVMFAAVILGRPSISMRSVSIAALITLSLHPEALISAGFQMSFAAVAALVTVYGLWRERYGPSYTPNLLRRFFNGLIGLTVTSTVAGAATGGFAAMHFHYMSRYGLIGNLFAMPIFTFLVMPMGIAAVILMPLGLEQPALNIMGRGLEAMLYVSDWVAQMPDTLMLVKASPRWAIGIYAGGYVLLCLGPLRRRIAGLAVMGAVCIVWSQTPQADFRISDDADIAFWDVSEQGHILYVQRKRADGYGVSQFVERAGLADADAIITEYSDDYAACDPRACRMQVRGKTISVVATPEAVREECASSDLVILTGRAAGPVLRRACAQRLIDMRMLKGEGAQDIYLTGETIHKKIANPTRRRNRPWGLQN